MKQRSLRLTLLLSGLILTGVLAACSPKTSGSGSASQTQEAQEPSEDEKDSDAAVSSDTEDANAEADSADTSEEIANVGTFTVEDINGTSYTETIFQDYELTLVNAFTTWCSPCVREIPDLEQLSQDMAEQGVGVVGIALDVADGQGGANADALEKAKLLAEQTGAAYPFLIPDATWLNGLVENIMSVPTTFFVDKEGNVVGSTYVGSRSLEDWTKIVEEELAALKESQ